MQRLDRIFTRPSWQRYSCHRSNCFQGQDGRAKVPCLQPRHGRFLHGPLLGISGHRGCLLTWGISKGCNPLAVLSRMPSCWVFRSSQFRTQRFHSRSHHTGEKLCHHPRDALEQEAVSETRGLHHVRGMDVLHPHGNFAIDRSFRLSKVCSLFAIRNRRRP